MNRNSESGYGTQKNYALGFILSILLTITAYVLVVNDNVFSGWALAAAVVTLALIQFSVQLIYFLHLGRESKPRWNLMVFLFMLMVVGIVVLGSLWIMANLNYHHDHNTVPSETDTYIIQDEGIKK